MKKVMLSLLIVGVGSVSASGVPQDFKNNPGKRGAGYWQLGDIPKSQKSSVKILPGGQQTTKERNDGHRKVGYPVPQSERYNLATQASEGPYSQHHPIVNCVPLQFIRRTQITGSPEQQCKGKLLGSVRKNDETQSSSKSCQRQLNAERNNSSVMAQCLGQQQISAEYLRLSKIIENNR